MRMATWELIDALELLDYKDVVDMLRQCQTIDRQVSSIELGIRMGTCDVVEVATLAANFSALGASLFKILSVYLGEDKIAQLRKDYTKLAAWFEENRGALERTIPERNFIPLSHFCSQIKAFIQKIKDCIGSAISRGEHTFLKNFSISFYSSSLLYPEIKPEVEKE